MTTNMTLGALTTKLLDLIESHEEGAFYGRGFDAGEFSGPAHARAATREAEALAKRYGFANLEAALEAITQRTSYRWVHFSGLGCLES